MQVGYKRKSGFLIHIQIQFFMLIPNPSSKTAPHFSEIFLNLVLDSSSVKTAPFQLFDGRSGSSGDYKSRGRRFDSPADQFFLPNWEKYMILQKVHHRLFY